MERTRLLQNGATAEGSGALLVPGDYSPNALSQGDGDAIQTDGSKVRAHAHALKQNRPARFGLPCANCKAYYASDLPACPICKCAERVPAVGERSRLGLTIAHQDVTETDGCWIHRQLTGSYRCV